MNNDEQRLIAAMALALSICRGALTTLVAKQEISDRELTKILHGTSEANIRDAINWPTEIPDWNKVLSSEEKAKVENQYWS
jgi:hypothetical protein